MFESLSDKLKAIRENNTDEWLVKELIEKPFRIKGEYVDPRHTKAELEEFINNLNFDIQSLGFTKKEVDSLINQMFKK